MVGIDAFPAVFLCIASVQFGYWLAWGGSLVLTVALIVLMWTRWGQSQPLQKCAALSLLVHLILAFLTMTVRIVVGDGGGGGGGSPIRVRIVQDTGRVTTISDIAAENMSDEVAPPSLLEPPPEKEEPKAQTADVEGTPAQIEETPPAAEKPAIESKIELAETHDAVQRPKLIEDSPAGKSTVEDKPEPSQAASVKKSEPATERTGTAQAPPTPTSDPTPPAAPEPAAAAPAGAYSLRGASDRLSLIAGQGGNAKTEAAVVAALNWLVAAQSRDGRWNANQFGAGQEQMVLGQDRGGAGHNADTGISALALLAFLGAGHSHLQGEYRDTVHRGLDFLLRSQADNGSLFGDATLYAQMYCHSMATFAIAESQAMSGDRRLQPAVTRAINFSLAAQNAGTGGWRYRPGDAGDTSQLGWQMMALASAKRAGVQIPDQTWNRVDRFLRSVRRGNFGGLASYRPDGPASTSMTAEALYCHLVLAEMNGVRLTEPAANEATTQLLTALPSANRVNLYYWYYGTLALHHRQQLSNDATAGWQKWNDALTTALLDTQVTVGQEAGSWDTNTMWGGYGGRVYTTAMAAMCLEVYYRYAPAPTEPDHWTATRQDSEKFGK
jgi:hypothetical protein